MGTSVLPQKVKPTAISAGLLGRREGSQKKEAEE